jgi:hypothetical protein
MIMREFNPNFSYFDNVYQPKPIEIQPTEALANNIQALINPTEVLHQKQVQQAVSTVADLKLQDLQGDLYNNAVKQYDNYLQEYQTELNANKGINRLKMTPEQQLKIGQKRKDLMQQVQVMKAVQTDYHQAQQRALSLLGKPASEGGLTQDEYAKWDSEMKDKMKSADHPFDYPFASLELGKLIDAKPKPDKTFENYNSIVNDIKTGLSGQGYTKPTADDATNYIKSKFLAADGTLNPVVKQRLADFYKVDPQTTPDETIIKMAANAGAVGARAKTYPVAPTVSVGQKIPNSDGTYTITPPDTSKEHTVLINGHNETVKVSIATYDPQTGKYVTHISKKVTKPDPSSFSGKKITVWEDETTDDYAVYRKVFIDEKSKNAEPKNVNAPKGATKQTTKKWEYAK